MQVDLSTKEVLLTATSLARLYWGIPAIVVFNKMDLFNGEFDLNFEADRLNELGVQSFEVSSENAEYSPQFLKQGLTDLESVLSAKTAIMVVSLELGKAASSVNSVTGKQYF